MKYTKRMISVVAALSIACTSAFAAGTNPYNPQAGPSSSITAQAVKETALNKTVRTKVALNVRAGAGTTYNVIGSLNKGDVVKVVDTEPGWYKIEYNKGYGYISMQYVRDTYKKRTVTAKKLNVRSGAGYSYSVLGTLKKGEVVKVVETNGDWYKIKYGKGFGYIVSKYAK